LHCWKPGNFKEYGMEGRGCYREAELVTPAAQHAMDKSIRGRPEGLDGWQIELSITRPRVS
jgi:hypothetical protein